ncbi:MAG: ATP-binding protein [Candidatus Aminicenantes bacterium]|nr:ATP-binding protein [Candidatus Aminicenantes bacterium]
MPHMRRTARMDGLHEILEFIDAGARESGFSEQARGRIRLAAEEALVNVILHAYRGAEGPVDVSWEKTPEQALVVEIRDQGIAFDPLEVEKPDTGVGLEERKVGGLGIFFIREVTDRVQYRRDGAENVLTLEFMTA